MSGICLASWFEVVLFSHVAEATSKTESDENPTPFPFPLLPLTNPFSPVFVLKSSVYFYMLVTTMDFLGFMPGCCIHRIHPEEATVSSP
jgi:hypothetical protein